MSELQQLNQDPSRTHTRYDTDRNPISVPLYDTDHEDFITAILERAQHHAQHLKNGDRQFELYMIEEEWKRCENSIEILAPLYVRASEYGLEILSTFNEKIIFLVLRP